MNINAQLSRKLAQERVRRGISKKSLAQSAGIDRSTVRFIEDPEQNPTIVNLVRYAMALNLDVGQLLSECLAPHLASTSKVQEGTKTEK